MNLKERALRSLVDSAEPSIVSGIEELENNLLKEDEDHIGYLTLSMNGKVVVLILPVCIEKETNEISVRKPIKVASLASFFKK